MPGPFQGWLYGQGVDGTPYELINHARTAAYLRDIGLPNGMLLCDVIDDGGCAAYAFEPPCEEGELTNPSYVLWPSGATQVNRLTVPDNANFSAPTQLDIRFALGGVASGSATRYVAFHGTSNGSNWSWYVTVDFLDRLQLVGSTTGTTTAWTLACDVALTTSDDLVLGRVTWRNSDGRIQFFRKLDVAADDIDTELTATTGWEQQGTNETGGTVTLFDSTATLSIGTAGSTAGSPFIGRMHGFWLSKTIDGAAVVKFIPANIPTNPAASTFVAATGQTVTVLPASSGPALSLVTDLHGGWDPASFSTPAVDNAPWYSATEPDSADALGFWVEQWTGLDNVHVTRNVQARGGAGGGGQLGVLSASERVMSLNVLLFARSEAAMEHLYRWFEQTLSNVCATCSTDAMLIRRYCPATTTDLWEGVAKLNQVGLIAGPQWEEEPLPHSACFLRRVNFTLAAGDPCMYGSGTEVAQDATVANVTTCLASLDVAEERNPCRPSCVEITDGTSCRSAFFYDVPASAAALMPVVTLENTAAEYTLPVRVIAYADPLGMETAPGVADPCGLQILGEIYVRSLRPGSTFVWDVASRDVQYRDHSTGGLAPGWAYVDPNDPPERRWFVLPCGQIVITVELATMCLDPLGGGVYSDGVHTFAAPHYPDMALEIVPRFGCP